MPPTRRISLPVVDSDVDGHWRPKTRGDCERVERPCPYVGCRYHLALQVNPATGSIGLNRPRPAGKSTVWRKRKLGDLAEQAVEWLQGMRETCALDVAERGAILEEVGQLIGVTRERVRQIEEKALRRLASALRREREAILEVLNRDQPEGHPLEQAQEVDGGVPGSAGLHEQLRRFERTDAAYRKSLDGREIARATQAGRSGGRRRRRKR